MFLLNSCALSLCFVVCTKLRFSPFNTFIGEQQKYGFDVSIIVLLSCPVDCTHRQPLGFVVASVRIRNIFVDFMHFNCNLVKCNLCIHFPLMQFQ